MDRLDQFLGVHETALRLRSQRMQVLASNIANAATPGFKARDVDFRALMAAAPSGAGALQRTDSRHLDGTTPTGAAGADGTDGLLYRQPIEPSLDGNTVELATEQLQFTETAIRYRTTIGLLNSRLRDLSSAMKGD